MPAPTTAKGDEIDLADLPPLDGEEGDESPEADDSGVADDSDDRRPGGAAADLDDSTGENDAPHPDDVEVDPGEGGWLEEPADAPGLPIGSIEIDDVEDAPSALGSDDGSPADERDAVEVDPVDADGLDTGEEGPDGPDEELRDQDLPSLGTAEDDEAPGGPVETDDLVLDAPGTDEPFGLPWAANPWTRVGAPIPIAAAVAVACTTRGAFVAGFREPASPEAPLELFRVDLEGACQAVGKAPEGGPVRRLAIAGGPVAAAGGKKAYAGEKGIVLVGADPSWRPVSIAGTVVALSFVDSGYSLVAAVYSENDDTTGLVRIDGAGVAQVMGLLGPTPADMESDGRALALAVDDPRGVVWVAGGFGVAIFSIR
ncbi:MAG: hypothetical protein ACRENE_19950 [Polyangiaceae bacterium]